MMAIESKTLPPWGTEKTISEFLSRWLVTNHLDEAEERVLRRYYQSYARHFGPATQRKYARQSRALVAAIQSGKVRNVLEVGAGCGTEALWFALQGASVTSIDVDASRLAVARSRARVISDATHKRLDVDFVERSLFDYNPVREFDAVWMEQSFHHLEPRERVFGQVANALRNGGFVFISESNGWNPLLQLSLFAKRGTRTVVRKSRSDGSELLYGNERITTPSALTKAFADHGIAPEQIDFFGVLPNWQMAQAAKIDDAVPQTLVPLFTHFNWIGRKRAASA